MLLCLLAGLGRLSAQKEMAQAEKLPILASSSWRQSVGGRKGEQKKGGMGIALLRNGGTGISIPPPLVAAAAFALDKKSSNEMLQRGIDHAVQRISILVGLLWPPNFFGREIQDVASQIGPAP